MPTDREQQEVERWDKGSEVVANSTPRLRKLEVSRMFPSEDGDWVFYEDHAAALQAEREKTEAAKLEASDLRVELQLAEWDRQRLRQKLSEQPDMADISGRSEAKDKPPITTHSDVDHSTQPDTSFGDREGER